MATERATELAANTRGICFIRVGRPAVPVVYENNEEFAIGKAKLVRRYEIWYFFVGVIVNESCFYCH